MRTAVLAPTPSELVVVQAGRRPGPPELRFTGLETNRARSIGDRARAAIFNSGFAVPTGCITLRTDPPLGAIPCGFDLAIALAVLLTEPSHAYVRRPGVVAWGSLGLDGKLSYGDGPLIESLPCTPWIGRFWDPSDRVPAPGESAVMSIVDVADLSTAWSALLGLLEVERHLQERSGCGCR